MDRLSLNTELQSRKEQATPRGVGVLTKVFAARAQNAEIWDVEGNRYIVTIPGRGYRFAAEVKAVAQDESATRPPSSCSASPLRPSAWTARTSSTRVFV